MRKATAPLREFSGQLGAYQVVVEATGARIGGSARAVYSDSARLGLAMLVLCSTRQHFFARLTHPTIYNLGSMA